MTLTIDIPQALYAVFAAQAQELGGTPEEAASRLLQSVYAELGPNAAAAIAASAVGEPRIADDAFWREMDEFIENHCGTAPR
jgi:hypothetical protein